LYTGIVEELGEIVAIERTGNSARITVRGPLVTADAAHGDSININGVCLTVTSLADGEFTADVMGETLDRSSLGALAAGTKVNLERPVRPDGRLGGHIVQGHVDGTGVITDRRLEGIWQIVRISLPAELSRYVVEKGSVAVDGISLTVSAVGSVPERAGAGPSGSGVSPGDAAAPQGSADCWFEVSLIPETLQRTTLGSKQVGEVVNLEVDLLAKIVERLMAGRQQ
jgi:riboflavin synthase